MERFLYVSVVNNKKISTPYQKMIANPLYHKKYN